MIPYIVCLLLFAQNCVWLRAAAFQTDEIPTPKLHRHDYMPSRSGERFQWSSACPDGSFLTLSYCLEFLLLINLMQEGCFGSPLATATLTCLNAICVTTLPQGSSILKSFNTAMM